MNWMVYLKDDEGRVHKGKAHYVHKSKTGVGVHFLNGDRVFVAHKYIVKFTKRRPNQTGFLFANSQGE